MDALHHSLSASLRLGDEIEDDRRKIPVRHCEHSRTFAPPARV